MKCSILTIGDELLSGKVINTNASQIGEWLTLAGVGILSSTVLPDNEKSISKAVKNSVSKSDLVIITGGLGPTLDDKTRHGIAAYLGAGGKKSHRAKKWLEEFCYLKTEK